MIGLSLADVCGAVVFTQPAWKKENDSAGSQFGWAIRTAGDVNNDGYDDLIVGAPAFSSNSGQVQIFHGSAAGLSQTPARTLTGAAGARMGISVASAGDVNNDGFDDIIIGSDFVGSGTLPRFEVYHGSLTGIGPTPARTVTGPALSELGYSVNGAGDVNNDGFDDVIVGQHDFSNGQTGEGRASVYLGSATGIAAAPIWAVESNLAGTSFGISVDGAGDVDGNGFDDVIVGHYRFGAAQPREGRALVYLSFPVSGIALTPAWTVESNQDFAEYGVTVAGAGDVNNDGFDDVIVGAWQWDGAFGDSGHAWVYLGSAGGLSTTEIVQFDGEELSAGLGWTVAGVGDMNGDGFDDVAAGAASHGSASNTPLDQGRAYVYYGRASGVEPTASRIYQSDQDSAQAGRGLGAAGDVDDDGYDDLALGAYLYDGGQSNEGRAYVHRGSATVPTYTFRRVVDYPFVISDPVRGVPNERLELGVRQVAFGSVYLDYYDRSGNRTFVANSGTGAGQFSNPWLRGIDANGAVLFQGTYDVPDPRSYGIELWHRLTGTREIFSRLKSAGGFLQDPSINDLGSVSFIDHDGTNGNLRLYRNFVLESTLATCNQMTSAVLNDAGALAFSCGNFSSQAIHLGTAAPFPVAVDGNSFSPADPGGNTALGIDASGTLAFTHFGNNGFVPGGLWLKHPASPPVLLDPQEACFWYQGFNDQGRVVCSQNASLRILAEPSVVQSHEIANIGTVVGGFPITSLLFDIAYINDLGQVAFSANLDDPDPNNFDPGAIVLATPSTCDADLDGFCDVQDTCPTTFNEEQLDSDGDGLGNACDNCPMVKNVDQVDSNVDGRGDACAPCNTSGTTLPLCGSISVGAGTTNFEVSIPIGALPGRPVIYAGARSNTAGLAVDAEFRPVEYTPGKWGCLGGTPHDGATDQITRFMVKGFGHVAVQPFQQFPTAPDRAGATCTFRFAASGAAGTYAYVVDSGSAAPTGGTEAFAGAAAPVELTAPLPDVLEFMDEATNHRFLYAGTGGQNFGTCSFVPDPPTAGDSPAVVYSAATATSAWDCCTFQFDGVDGVPSSVGQLVFNLNGPLPPPDPDGDGFLSPCDSCDYINDVSQADRGGLGTGTTANGIGDSCECGELSNDGKVDPADVLILRNSLAKIGPPLTPSQLAHCAVIGNAATCNVRTVSVIRKALGPPLVPSLIQPTCTAALPP